MSPSAPARLFLIPAFKAPRCVVIRRKPSKLWHVMLWHTDTDQIEHGSWFRGTLYPHRMDLSWEGEYMVYLASGSTNTESWNGICRPPWLKTLVEWENNGSWTGGGVFDRHDRLIRNCLIMPMGVPVYAQVQNASSVPFSIGKLWPTSSGEEEVLDRKLERDGWTGSRPQWDRKPSDSHPTLRMHFAGYGVSGKSEFRAFEFSLESNTKLLDGAQWATWDSLGQLLVARKGWIERYALDDLGAGDPKPSFSLDLNALEPPPKPTAADDRVG